MVVQRARCCRRSGQERDACLAIERDPLLEGLADRLIHRAEACLYGPLRVWGETPPAVVPAAIELRTLPRALRPAVEGRIGHAPEPFDGIGVRDHHLHESRRRAPRPSQSESGRPQSRRRRGGS